MAVWLSYLWLQSTFFLRTLAYDKRLCYPWFNRFAQQETVEDSWGFVFAQINSWKSNILTLASMDRWESGKMFLPLGSSHCSLLPYCCSGITPFRSSAATKWWCSYRYSELRVCLHSADPRNPKRGMVPISLPIPCHFTCQHHGDRHRQRLHVKEVMLSLHVCPTPDLSEPPSKPSPELVWHAHHTASEASAIYTTSSDLLFFFCPFPPWHSNGSFNWEDQKCALTWQRLLICDTGSIHKEAPFRWKCAAVSSLDWEQKKVF